MSPLNYESTYVSTIRNVHLYPHIYHSVILLFRVKYFHCPLKFVFLFTESDHSFNIVIFSLSSYLSMFVRDCHSNNLSIIFYFILFYSIFPFSACCFRFILFIACIRQFRFPLFPSLLCLYCPDQSIVIVVIFSLLIVIILFNVVFVIVICTISLSSFPHSSFHRLFIYFLSPSLCKLVVIFPLNSIHDFCLLFTFLLYSSSL